MHDVTEQLHPGIVDVALAAARAGGLPVAGVDLYIDSVDAPDAVVIEVNQQAGARPSRATSPRGPLSRFALSGGP